MDIDEEVLSVLSYFRPLDSHEEELLLSDNGWWDDFLKSGVDEIFREIVERNLERLKRLDE